MLTAVALLSIGTALSAQTLPGLPDELTRDDSLPLPAGLLGFEPGDRHPHHHELLDMYQTLAELSDRVQIETIGRSHGGRSQVLLYFASPERLAELEEIRDQRQDASRAGEGPPVIWLGYAVHGNEASAASAAALTAWYLAASNDDQVQNWLNEMIIVMEPMINPDGIDRFAHWVNNHRGRHPSSDPRDREHNEVWPNGRTSYYWFDLNRDWLPLTHPESQNRLREYHRWRPHVLTDVHEMGHNATYFFQPGVPERNNPATPSRVFEITQKIAQFHANILDQAGEPFYTKEVFDDYYAGKGSTYPDLTGSVGILFEQASARGHRMQTHYGERSFAEAIANQVRTSISSLKGAYAHQDELLDYQAEFFTEALESGGGWILADSGDPGRAESLLRMLLGHAIEVRPTTGEVTIDGVDYPAGRAWVIPARQDQFRLIRSIFDAPTELPMETFYDVSAWPMHLAYNLPLSEVRSLPESGAPLTRTSVISQTPATNWPEQAPAWIIRWDQYRAPAVAAALLREGYRVQAIKQPSTVDLGGVSRELVRGSIIVHPAIQEAHLPSATTRLKELSRHYGVELLAADTGLSLAGLDLGSPNAPVLQPLNPALVVGPGVRANHAGYLWHWFDTRLDQPVVQLDLNWLARNRIDLSEYSHLLLPDGSYDNQPDTFKQNLTDYVHGGGQLIAMRNASKWVESLDLDWAFVESQTSSDETESDAELRRYADFDQDFVRTLIGGSALNMTLDVTHPLGFGYTQDAISTFRRGSHVLQSTRNAYAAPGRYAENPLMAGYLSKATREQLSATTALDANRFGRGVVIRMADDYVFRGYWVGTEKLLANALMFGSLIESTRLPAE
ncbi:MAG: M14 family zinc carboxypeptidase [Pseudomonadota bacterium]